MSYNDPMADMLTRVRNAAAAGHDKVSIPHSRVKESVARIICDEGFLRGMEVVGSGLEKALVIDLKYQEDGRPTFSSLHRVSRLGRRYYVSVKDIKPTRQGMGVAILTTSKGIMKDVDARRQGVGGEVLCTIW